MRILSKWHRSEVATVSQPATKCLSNLCSVYNHSPVYGPHLYPLHPPLSSSEPSAVDIVFVHGLLGGAARTWRQCDQAYRNKGNSSYSNPHVKTSTSKKVIHKLKEKIHSLTKPGKDTEVPVKPVCTIHTL